MSEQVAVNLVKLAGEVKSVNVAKKDGGFVLVDSGMEHNKYIPCTIFDSEELATKLKTFQKDDYIQIVGFVRSWSQKKEETWVNHVEVRITEIKNAGTAKAAANKKTAKAEEIPF